MATSTSYHKRPRLAAVSWTGLRNPGNVALASPLQAVVGARRQTYACTAISGRSRNCVQELFPVVLTLRRKDLETAGLITTERDDYGQDHRGRAGGRRPASGFSSILVAWCRSKGSRRVAETQRNQLAFTPISAPPLFCENGSFCIRWTGWFRRLLRTGCQTASQAEEADPEQEPADAVRPDLNQGESVRIPGANVSGPEQREEELTDGNEAKPDPRRSQGCCVRELLPVRCQVRQVHKLGNPCPGHSRVSCVTV